VREVIGGTIGAWAPMGVPAVAKAQSVAATIIAIACLSVTACGPQSGIASSSAAGESSPQAQSAPSGSGQASRATGSVPDACSILTQSRASTIAGADTNVQSQSSAANTVGLSDAAIVTSCLWEDQASPIRDDVGLIIVRDPKNADIVGALKNFFAQELRFGGNLIAVRGLGDSAVKLVIAAATQDNEAYSLVSVGFTKGQALAVIGANSTKRSADAIEPEEEMILHQVADQL
jgi:hypothetical protein